MLYFQALKKFKKERKVTSQDIADFLGKARITVASWEIGKYQPGDADIRLMAQFLNVSVSDISDLKEIKINNANVEKEDIPDLDIKDLTPDNASQRLKALHDSCLEFHATNTRLRANLFKYESLLQNLPFIIYVKDKKLKYRFVNERFLNLIGQGYTKESIMGSLAYDIFGMKEYSQVLELEQKALQTKQKISNQQIYIPGTFKKKIGLLTIIPILNDNKEVEEIISSIEDISDTYEEQERRKDLEAVVNKVNHMLWIGESINGSEDSFRCTFISDNVYDIYGFDKQEFIKDNRLWLKIVHDDDAEMVNNWNIDNWKETDNFPKKIEYKINNPKKGVSWISSEIFKEGRGKFYGIITDVTEKKEKERERETILRTLDAANDAIQIVKIENNSKEYIYLNKENKNLYDLPISKIKNSSDLWQNLIHMDDRKKLLSLDEEKKVGHKRINYRLSLPSGEIKYIEENIFREFIDGILYSGTIKRDVTLEKKAEEENNALRDAILKEAEKQNSILRYAMDKVDKVVWVGHFPNKAKRAHEAFEYFYINDAVYDMFGLTKEEWCQNKWVETVCPEYGKLIDDHVREEYPFLEYRIIHKVTKEEKWLNAIMYKNDNMFFGFISDVTKQKKAEEENNVLRYAMDKVDKVVWVGHYPENVKRAHENFEYFYVNDAVYDMFGLTKEELAQGKWVELVCPEHKKLVEDHARNDFPFLEFKLTHKITGEIKWINAILYKH